MKLIDALISDFPESSKRKLLNWIKFGRVTIEGKAITKPHYELEERESYAIKEKKQEVEGIPILYRDAHLLVIDKPAGLLSVPAPNGAPSALKILSSHYKTKNLFAVHRIDQETSGVLLFVWGKKTQAAFDPLFAEHRLERQYIAIVQGHLPQERGSWRAPLKELENYDVVVDPEGKKACTHYRVLRRSKNFSYLLLTLETGRKHQIRVHCQEAGYPILGDRRYGEANERLYLHAYKLAFTHPFTGKALSFCSPPPSIFRKRGFLPESLIPNSSPT